jgi:hypothetical protein
MEWNTARRESTSREIANPIELWNIKNRAYLPLQELNALNLTTESIFNDAASVMELISTTFSVNYRTTNFVNFDESTKYESRDSHYYRDFYNNERWRSELTDSAIEIINRHLDKNVMEHFGYEYLNGDKIKR